MKKLAIFCLVGLFSVHPAAALKRDASANYVVIGAFSVPKHAIEFAENATKVHLHAEYSMNPMRKLFYVYVLATDDRTIAVEQAKKLRKETPYFDTWVYSGPLGEMGIEDGKDVNPITGNSISKIESNDTNQVTITEPTTLSQAKPETKTITTNSSASSVAEERPEGSKRFLFKIFSADKTLAGDVDVMDLDKIKIRKMASYRGNEPVSVKPVNKSGNISLVCEVFGYRKMNYNINFNDPKSTEGISEADGKVVVPYDLVRLKKGDFAIMYNVFYYKDAAIMRPESRYEVTSLLDMLKENPKYRIRIHGHTNGNSSGKIISMGETKNYFSLNDTKESHGSAKRLSEERAKVIQAYLVSQGIDATRMEIKAWGGNRPIYDEDHQLAQANVRVEVEILED